MQTQCNRDAVGEFSLYLHLTAVDISTAVNLLTIVGAGRTCRAVDCYTAAVFKRHLQRRIGNARVYSSMNPSDTLGSSVLPCITDAYTNVVCAVPSALPITALFAVLTC